MKTKLLLLCLLLLPISISAQEKGVVPVASPQSLITGTTRAVIIGISDYQDEKIPDLQFADRDALAFAEFLRSKAGGSLSEDQLKVLTNEGATEAQTYMALDWLRDESNENDLAIIYFSGHGDAEVKLRSQPGFLLTYDSPAQIPKVSCVRLNDLEDYISTITLDKKTRVIVITDACHSGKLAGREGGSRMANTELAAMSEKAIKILSCQPDELSYEGIQWGGGRGAFSYFLVNGLYGMADNNGDQQVTLTEIGRYLEDNVSREVSPSSQFPNVIGNPKERMAEVFPDELAKIRDALEPLEIHFKPIVQRGIEDETLAKVDSATRKRYYQFKAAVAGKQFFEPAAASADSLYNQLIHVAELQLLYNIMRRNYAAALMDDAQEAMNGWLRSDPRETESWGSSRKYDYLKFPLQLARAAELLGKEHYLYNDLKAKEYFFKARIQIVEMGGEGVKSDSPLLPALLETVNKGLEYDSMAPYLYAKKAYYYGYKMDYEKGEEFLQKAIDLAPTWVWAYATIGYQFILSQKHKKAFDNLRIAFKLDSTNLKVLNNLALCLDNNHQFEEEKRIGRQIVSTIESLSFYDSFLLLRANYYWSFGFLDKAEANFKQYIDQIEQSSDNLKIKGLAANYGAYNQLACVKIVQGDWQEAEKWWLKQAYLLGDTSGHHNGSAWVAYTRGQLDEANRILDSILLFKKLSFNIDQSIGDMVFLTGIYDLTDFAIFTLKKVKNYFPDHASIHYHLARIYLEQKNNYTKGLPLLKKAVQLAPKDSYTNYHLATAYAHQGRNKKALKYLEKALGYGYEDFEEMEKDARWDALRRTERFEKLLKQYNQDSNKN